MILYYRKEAKLKCQHRLTGRNCNACAPNFGPPGQCDQCLRGWTGENCNECATNFDPPGKCDQCLRGWGGENCDVCEFGFSTESNCTECIEEGEWAGTYVGAEFISIKMTFKGPACSNLVPGVY